MSRASLLTYAGSAPEIAALLVLARSAPLLVTSLTDEELLCLDGVGVRSVAPSPWLQTLSASERAVAGRVALRSLAARGFAAMSQEPSGDVVVTLPGDVAAVLAMRRAASTIVVAEQRTAEVHRTRVLYVQGEHGVLEEDVNPGGLHRFTVHSRQTALTALRVWCNPTRVPMPVDGPRRTATLPELADGGEVSRHLALALVVSVVGAVVGSSERAGEPAGRRLSVYAHPDHVEVGAPDPADSAVLVYDVVGEQALAARLAALIAAP